MSNLCYSWVVTLILECQNEKMKDFHLLIMTYYALSFTAYLIAHFCAIIVYLKLIVFVLHLLVMDSLTHIFFSLHAKCIHCLISSNLILILLLYFAAWKPVWAWYFRVFIQPIWVTQVPASVRTAYGRKEPLHHYVMTFWVISNWFL